MKSRKIILVGPSLSTQGGISSVLRIYNSYYKCMFNYSLVSTYSGKSRIKDILFFACSIFIVIIYCILNNKIIFHIHTSSKGSFFRKSSITRICLLFGKEVILHIHGGRFDRYIEDSKETRKRKIINLLNSSKKIVVLSDSWKNYFSQYIPQDKIMVIYNPSVACAESYNKRCNPKVNIVFAGRMSRLKGTYDLIEAVKRILGDNFVLNLYGDGDNNKIKRIVEESNLHGRVFVYGWIPHEEMVRIYDSADILVLPSYAEGLPMSILEAMARGLPIISTNIGGILEAVTDGVNGFVINPGEVDKLAEKLELLINNEDLREHMGRSSLEIVKVKFSVDEIGKSLKKLYSISQ